jgi:hypothetical protein
VGFVVRKLEAHTRFARHRNHFLHGQKQIIRLASEVHSKQRSTIRDLFGDAHQLTLVGEETWLVDQPGTQTDHSSLKRFVERSLERCELILSQKTIRMGSCRTT